MSAPAGSTLQIRFAAGERPHLFWVSRWEHGRDEATRYKVLTKRRSDASLDVLVLEERISGPRRRLARESVPSTRPSGWLSHWVSELERSLDTRFVEFDLRRVESRDEWRRIARRLGWSLAEEPRENA